MIMSGFNNKFDHLGGEMFVPLQKLGSGGHGVVYLCQSLDTEEMFAIKVEKAKLGSSLIKESAILKQIIGIEGIPKFKWFLSTPNNNILMMERLGESLHSIQKQSKDWKLQLESVVDVGIQCVDILENLHSAGYIHGDIKPSNLVYGYSLKDCNKLHVIDFGCSSEYKSKSGKHKAPTSVENFIGTPMFASTTAFEFFSQSRRDDLISLGYTLVYLYTGTLPWLDCCRKLTQSNYEMCYKMKKDFIGSFPKNIPLAFKKFMIYTSLLLYTDLPKYDYLRDILKSLLNESS